MDIGSLVVGVLVGMLAGFWIGIWLTNYASKVM